MEDKDYLGLARVGGCFAVVAVRNVLVRLDDLDLLGWLVTGLLDARYPDPVLLGFVLFFKFRAEASRGNLDVFLFKRLRLLAFDLLLELIQLLEDLLVVFDMEGLRQHVLANSVILTSPGLVLFAFKDLAGLLVENVVVLHQCLELLNDVVGERTDFLSSGPEHVVDRGVDVGVDVNALLASSTPTLFVLAEAYWYNLPGCIVLEIGYLPLLVEGWRHFVVVQDVQIELWLLQGLGCVLVLQEGLVDLSV